MNDNKVSVIRTAVTTILSCYILLESCFISYDILKFQHSVSVLRVLQQNKTKLQLKINLYFKKLAAVSGYR